MILIDSDILIWILRNNEKYKKKIKQLIKDSQGHVYITPIQYLEIISGIRPKERINTEIFLDSICTINIDKKIGKLAGEFINLYKKSHGIHSADSIMAATSKIYNLKIWSNNKKHYPMLNKNEFYE